MAKVVVFDSGLGSLSIIKHLRKKLKSDTVYFADQKNFPYGAKSALELGKIIDRTISVLQKKFKPDLIVVGSNTPSILLKKITKDKKIIGVFPPLKAAVKKTKTSSIAILTTKSVVKSKALKDYVKSNIPKKINVIKIDTSSLVEIVESGKFISNKKACKEKINQVLTETFDENDTDVATLSSTHLPFLLPILKQTFPKVTFLDPAKEVAEKVARLLRKKQSKRVKMQIITTGDAQLFQKKLYKLGIKSRVSPFTVA